MPHCFRCFLLKTAGKSNPQFSKEKLPSIHLSRAHVSHRLLLILHYLHRTTLLRAQDKWIHILIFPIFVLLHHPNLRLNAALFTWLEILLWQFSQVNLLFICDAALEEGKAIIILCTKANCNAEIVKIFSKRGCSI